MGRKITAIRVDCTGRTVSVRAMSKSLRGATFTLKSTARELQPKDQKELKEVVAKHIEEVIQGTE